MSEGRGSGNIDWSQVDLSGFGFGRRGGGQRRRPGRANVVILLIVALFFLMPIVFGPLITFLTDLLWFRSVGFEDVYTLRYSSAAKAFLAFSAAFFVLALPNLYFALRPRMPRVVVVEQGRRESGAFARTLRLMPVLLVPAFLFGLIGAGQWEMLLRWLNATPFGQVDPVFGRDIGFYFFTLPAVEFVRGWLIGALLVIAIGAVAIYAIRSVAGVTGGSLASGDLAVAGRTALTMVKPARAHLSVLGGLFLALIAVGYQLDQFDLLFRDEGTFSGLGYTSANARLPGLTIVSVIVGLAALACLANAFVGRLSVLGAALTLWIVASIAALGIYPAIVQGFVVEPDELNKERPYIERNIAATREAFGLADAEESAFDVATSPTLADAQRELGDTSTVRLWDYRPLLDAYQQLQALRQYYGFHDVDVDRYVIGGVEHPVMLSARELDQSKLATEAKTWQNLHLVFTHGYGTTLTTVGGVTGEGLPALELRDIPIRGAPEVREPRIYYGELTTSYAIVGTTQDEFDYPSGEVNATTRFSGKGGVGIASVWDRLLFALRFGDFNMLISTQLGAESRVLFNREISARAQDVAPFLRFDADPYLVVSEGKLYWIQDAYITGDRYPYGAQSRGINYIRNSVKVVTDAYDGSMTFYVADASDAVIQTYRAIYPSLLSKTLADMPTDLREHLRYPEGMFDAQVDVFRNYHMTDPTNFYNRDDAWRIANEIRRQGAQSEPVEPYYVLTQLPGSTRREFVLFVPMTPAGAQRDNMVAWIAGRADAPEYGKLRVLRFPKDRTIFGPLQIEGRIDADATIRQQLTLLGGGGASVIRGNLLVLPVGNSFVYVEPLFVQAEQGRIPELKRVILATQDRVTMASTFEAALAQLFGQTPPQTPSQPTEPGTSTDVTALVRQASEQYQRAQDALRAGDFAEYGRQITALEQTLARLRTLTGQ